MMAATTKVKDKPAAQQEKIADELPASKGAVAHFQPARLPYGGEFLERDYGVTKGQWKVLVDAIYPAAKTEEAVVLALAYCKQRNLDPFKKPVHIVPMWDTKKGAYIETVWPSISELRTTATRTKLYAGIDEAVFGPTIKRTFSGETYVDRQKRAVEIEVEFPEWCRMTVWKIVGNARCPFVGPKVLWEESYATIGKTDLPNNMWQERTVGQLEKCAEAAALRRAFPEELGNDYAAEEMEGRKIENIAPGIEVMTTASKRDDGPPKRAEVAKEVTKEEVTDGEFTETVQHDEEGVVQENGSHVSGDPVDDMDDGGNDSMDDAPEPKAHKIDTTGMSYDRFTEAYIDAIRTAVDPADLMRFIDLNRGGLDKVNGVVGKGHKENAAKIKRESESILKRLREPAKKADPISSGPAKTDDGPPKRAAAKTTAKPAAVDPEDILKSIGRILDEITDPNDLEHVWMDKCVPLTEDLTFPGDNSAAQALYSKAEKRLGID